MFKDIHKRRKSHLATGSSTDSDQDDTHFYRCKNCGWICDDRKVEVAGPRESADSELTGVVIATDDDGDYYPTQTSGCPQCGSLYSR